MGKVIASEFITLDGVIEDPGGADNFELGGWAFQFERGPEGDKFKMDEVMEAESLLLGRVTYEGFAKAWPSRTGDFADKMNGMPKYVVSSTLTNPTWNNTTIMKGNITDAVTKLKETHQGDILIAGSGRLVNVLTKNHLIDEYRLMLYPVILGMGKQLFGAGIDRLSLKLVEVKPVGGGIIILIYHPDRIE